MPAPPLPTPTLTVLALVLGRRRSLVLALVSEPVKVLLPVGADADTAADSDLEPTTGLDLGPLVPSHESRVGVAILDELGIVRRLSDEFSRDCC